MRTVVLIQLLAVLIESIVLTQLPLADIVPSLSILTLILLRQKLKGRDVLVSSLLSGVVIDALRPSYSPWYTVLFTLLSIIFIAVAGTKTLRNLLALDAALITKHVLFFLVLLPHVSVSRALVSLIFDVVICSVGFTLLQRKTVQGGVFDAA